MSGLTPHSPVVRRAQQSDLGAILAILNDAISTGASNFHWEPRDLEELLSEWKAALGVYPWFVVAQGEEVQGYAKAGPFRSKRAYAWSAEVTIYLAAGARGRGLGRVLYSKLLGELRDLGFHLAIGSITLPNPGSEALHRSMGFEPIGVYPEIGWKFEAWHDVAQWAKKLDDAPPS